MPGVRWISRRWQDRAFHVARATAFDPAAITIQTDQQQALEQCPHTEFAALARPTEMAVGAAFAPTAVLAQCSDNYAPLTRIGEMYGRIMFVPDSLRDYAADQAKGAFNALARCFPPDLIQHHAHALATDAHQQLVDQFDQLRLPQLALAHPLLVHQLRANIQQTLRDPVRQQPRRDNWCSNMCEGCADCCSCTDGCIQCYTCCGDASDGSGCCDGCSCDGCGCDC